MSDEQTFRAIWLISLLLMVLAATLPMVRSRRHRLRQAAIWILTLGFLLAFTASCSGSRHDSRLMYPGAP